jgi:hypothetical protein
MLAEDKSLEEIVAQPGASPGAGPSGSRARRARRLPARMPDPRARQSEADVDLILIDAARTSRPVITFASRPTRW